MEGIKESKTSQSEKREEKEERNQRTKVDVDKMTARERAQYEAKKAASKLYRA